MESMSESGKNSKIRIGRSLLSNEAAVNPLFEMPDIGTVQQWLIALTLTLAIYETNGMRKAFIVASLLSLVISIRACGNRYNMAMLGHGILRTPVVIVLPSVYFVGIGLYFAKTGGASVGMGVLTLMAFGALFVSALGMALFTDDHRSFYRALAIGGTFVALHAFLQMWRRTPDPGWLLNPVRWWHDPGSYHVQMRLGMGSFPWSSRIAAWLNVISGTCMALISYSKNWKQKTFWSACLFAMVAGTFFSGSRTGLVILMIIALVFAARKQGIGRNISAGLACLGVFAIGIMATMRRSPIRGDGSLRSRFSMWKLCLEIARDHPVFGSGVQSFKRAWPTYAVKNGYNPFAFQDPHNVYMLMLSDGGFVMLGFAILLMLSILWYAVAAIRSKLPRGARTFVLLLTVGLVMIPINDLIDDAIASSCIQTLVIALCGIICGMRIRAQNLAKG